MKTKPLFLMLAMQVLPLTLLSQTVFHDGEANEVMGPVKSIKTTYQGNTNVIHFSKEGKMSFPELEEAEYDADGYIQTAILKVAGSTTVQTYKWENGNLSSIKSVTTVAGMTITGSQTRKYDARNVVVSETTEGAGFVLEMIYADYIFDSKGNWIHRQWTVDGETFAVNREIEYY